MTIVHQQYFSDNNQRIYFFENGYAISRIHNNFSHGTEILVFKWRPRRPSLWEKIQLKLRLIEDFFYDNIGKAEENIARSKFWCDGTYNYLTSEETQKIIEIIKEIKK